MTSAETMTAAATTIQAIFRGNVDRGTMRDEHLYIDPEMWLPDDLFMLFDGVDHGRSYRAICRLPMCIDENPLSRRLRKYRHSYVNYARELQLALIDRNVKWALRYSKYHFLHLASHSLIEIIIDYQESRLCAVGQVLSQNGIPHEVFAAHCGGLDIRGMGLLRRLEARFAADRRTPQK